MIDRTRRLAAPWVALVLALGACGGADSGETTTTTVSDATTTSVDAGAGSLDDCPNPLVIQTDWFPEPEHGALYQLTGGQGSIDPETGAFRGPLTDDPDLTIEIRAGGPYIGFQPQTTMMYSDDSIFLAYINTDSQIASFPDFPSIAVVAPLEKNPQLLMFDPETYDFETFSDIGESGAVVSVFAGVYYPDYLVGTGQLTADQIDPSYTGSQARFIAEDGALVQQGFVTQEPWNYENVFAEWGRPVDWLLIHDSGYEIYSQVLAIRADKLDETASSCLTAFVPLVQQAVVDFMADPGPVNDAILRAVEDLESFWELDPAGVENTVQVMDELDIVGNGPNDTVGDFDLDRVEALIDQLRVIPAFEVGDVEATDIVTNEFIDPSIGF